MKRRFLLLGCLIVSWGGFLPGAADAAVVVIANRTEAPLDFEILNGDEEPTRYRLQPNESEPIAVSRAVRLRTREETPETFELRPDAVYFFGRGPEGLKFEEIGFSAPADPQQSTDAGPGSESGELPQRVALPSIGTVKVKVLFDDELASRRNPEKRLRARVRAASLIFERAARIHFEIISVGGWESIDRVTDFNALMIDFERKVEVEPGVLAIGFSTQASRSKTRMGGTRLPLHSHILVRERGQRLLSEPAQLELLVHELGHYLGAVHSPEWSSAMRPKLGDGLAGSPGFRIGLDPVNTMIVYLVGEELRAHKLDGVWDLHPTVKSRLRRMYGDLAKSLPDDPAAGSYLKALELTAAPPTKPPALAPLAKHIRHVVEAVTTAAEENVQRADKRVAVRYGKRYRLSGDELTELYVRRAAAAAREVPAAVRPHAFAIGLAVALDSSTRLRDNRLTQVLWRSIETEREHRFRKAVLGQPTMRGRADLTQHFCVSAGLAALFGATVAETAGVWKEQTDGTFSRGDYSADLAGIRLFTHLTDAPDRLEPIEKEFRIADYVPLCRESDAEQPRPGRTSTSGKGLSEKSENMRAEIMREIESLPAYAPRTKEGEHGRKKSPIVDRENDD